MFPSLVTRPISFVPVVRTSYSGKMFASHMRPRIFACTRPFLPKIQSSGFAVSAKDIKKIGFIGLGNMGSGMSANLINKGYEVIVHDLNSDYVKRIEKIGGKNAGNGHLLAEQVDCIVTMLPTGDDVTALYTGKDGILKNVKQGTLLIDSSTIDPVVPQKLSPIFKSHGALFIDAPVSGGVMAADKGTLTFMVGGDKDIISMATPILLSMGSKVIQCGEIGCGQIAKICNNMLLGISMAGLSEAMHLAISLGLDPKLMSSVINSSSGRSWSSEIYCPVPGVMDDVPSTKGYQPGFASQMILKDLRLAETIAKRAQTSLDFGKKALDTYNKICENNWGNKDFSIAYKFIKEKGNNA